MWGVSGVWGVLRVCGVLGILGVWGLLGIWGVIGVRIVLGVLVFLVLPRQPGLKSKQIYNLSKKLFLSNKWKNIPLILNSIIIAKYENLWTIF